MSKFNMPIKKEKSKEKGGGSSFDAVPEIWRPLPDKAGAVHSNKVIIPLLRPANWKLFNPDQEMVQRYGLVDNNGGLIAIPEDLYTFYFKVIVHRVPNFQRADGTIGFSYVFCPNKMNYYLRGVLEYDKLFETDHCEFCNREQELWDVFNSRLEELGYDEDRKKSLDTESYRALVDGDKLLKTTRKTARDYKATERYIIPIFDYDKMIGNRKMDDGQEFVQHQFWIAPKSVFDGLYAIHENGVEFYDTENPEVMIVTIKKDTTKCVGNDMIKTAYTVVSGNKVSIDKQWLDYISNVEAMSDPSKFIQLASKSEMQYYLGVSEEKTTHSNTPQSTTQPSSQPAPSMNMPPAQSSASNSSPAPDPVQGSVPTNPAASAPVPAPPTNFVPQTTQNAPMPAPIGGDVPKPVPPQPQTEAASVPPTPDRNPPDNSPVQGRRSWD